MDFRQYVLSTTFNSIHKIRHPQELVSYGTFYYFHLYKGATKIDEYNKGKTLKYYIGMQDFFSCC